MRVSDGDWMRSRRKEHRETRQSLRYARCQVAVLEAKIQRMKQKARDLIADATEDVSDKVGERFIQARTGRLSRALEAAAEKTT
jgi:predicted Zn-dependent protease